MIDTKPTIDPQTIKAIESVLAKGQRVELIPLKDYVKIVCVKREEIRGCKQGGNKGLAVEGRDTGVKKML